MKCSLNILLNVPQWWKWSVLYISCLICHNYANEVFFKYTCHYHTIFHLNIVFCWSCRSWCERIKTVSINLLYICNLNSSVSRKTPVLSDVDNFGHGFEFNENGAPHQKNKSGPGPPTSLTRPCRQPRLLPFLAHGTITIYRGFFYFAHSLIRGLHSLLSAGTPAAG